MEKNVPCDATDPKSRTRQSQSMMLEVKIGITLRGQRAVTEEGDEEALQGAGHLCVLL